MEALRAIGGEPPPSEELWYWIGLAGFVVGMLVIVGLWVRGRGEDQDHFVLAFAAAALAAISYFAMGAGLLDFQVADSHVAQVPHYVDWLVTTPLLLLSLVIVGLPPVQHFARQRERTTLVTGLLGLNTGMLLCVLFAQLTETRSHQRVWYAIAAACFLAVAWLLLVSSRQRAQAHGGRNVGIYHAMALFLVVSWALYGVAWALGPQGAGDLWGETTDAAVLTVLDLASNLVFSLLLLLGLERLRHQVPERTGHGTIELASGFDEVDDALEAERSGRFQREPQAGQAPLLP
ncbi:MAG: microbial rhodopsin family protein [Actinomycetota bacterium]|nr:microbial rhodopsin family protein [Actinomycetota bacterium]